MRRAHQAAEQLPKHSTARGTRLLRRRRTEARIRQTRSRRRRGSGAKGGIAKSAANPALIRHGEVGQNDPEPSHGLGNCRVEQVAGEITHQRDAVVARLIGDGCLVGGKGLLNGVVALRQGEPVSCMRHEDASGTGQAMGQEDRHGERLARHSSLRPRQCRWRYQSKQPHVTR